MDTFKSFDVINGSPETNFTQISNDMLRDPELSWKAKGLLCALLSNKNGWKSHLSVLVAMSRDGHESTNNGLNELQDNGYFIRCAYVDKKTKRKAGSFWAYTYKPFEFNLEKYLKILDENGFEIWKGSIAKEGEDGGDNSGNPVSGKPITGKPIYGSTGYGTAPEPIETIKEIDEKTSPNNTNIKNNILSKDNIWGKTRRTIHPKIFETTTSPPKKENNGKVSLFKQYGKFLPLMAKATGRVLTDPLKYQWTNLLKKSVEENGVPIDELENVLLWYIDNKDASSYIPAINGPKDIGEKWGGLVKKMNNQENEKKQAQRDKFNNRRAYQTDRHDESKHKQLQWTKSDDELLESKITRGRVLPLTPQEIAEGKTL